MEHGIEPVGWCPSLQTVVDPAGNLYLLPPNDRTPIRVRGPLGSELATWVASQSSGHRRPPSALVADAVTHLRSMGLLLSVDRLDTRRIPARLERQGRYFVQCGHSAVECQRALADAVVLVIGLGGAGGVVAEQLVRSGIGAIVGIDCDVVDEENLGRQTLYTHADIGTEKVESARRRLTEIAAGSETEVTTETHHLTDTSSLVRLINLWRPSVAVVTADTPQIAIREWTFDASCATGVPYVTCAQSLPFVSAGPFVDPARQPCRVCMTGVRADLDPEMVTAVNNHDFTLAAVGSADAIAASLLAMDVVHWLAGIQRPATDGRRLRIDLRTFATEWVAVGCDDCSATTREAA